MKRRIALLLAVCLFIGSPFMAFAEKPEVTGRPSHVVTPLYVNLGDSIAYGMSAEPGQSYFDRYAKTLHPGRAYNLGVAGLTSEKLLAGFSDDYPPMVVGSADVITISIGGNNLLGPVILAMSDLFNITPAELVTIHNDPIALNDAFAAATATLSINYGFNPQEDDLIAAIVDYVIITAGEDLTMGAIAFQAHWPAIYNSIREMNQNATIKVLNLYNPVKEEEIPLLYTKFEGLLAIMNQTLYQHQNEYDYKVVDVHAAFGKDKKSVDFSLELDSLNLDPHPTTKGHQIIFRELMKLGNVRAFQPSKPEGVGKILDLPAVYEVTGAEF